MGKRAGTSHSRKLFLALGLQGPGACSQSGTVLGSLEWAGAEGEEWRAAAAWAVVRQEGSACVGDKWIPHALQSPDGASRLPTQLQPETRGQGGSNL